MVPAPGRRRVTVPLQQRHLLDRRPHRAQPVRLSACAVPCPSGAPCRA